MGRDDTHNFNIHMYVYTNMLIYQCMYRRLSELYCNIILFIDSVTKIEYEIGQKQIMILQCNTQQCIFNSFF